MLFLIKLVQFSKKKKLNETTLKGLSCATCEIATSDIKGWISSFTFFLIRYEGFKSISTVNFY